MARELKYPAMEVRGNLVLNVAASLPRLTDVAYPVGGSGGSSASLESMFINRATLNGTRPNSP
jgi:hypothetical protein